MDDRTSAVMAYWRVAVLVCSLVVVPAVSRVEPGEPGREVVISSTGGALEEALREHFYEPFTRATGIKVIPATAPGGSTQGARVKAMVDAGTVEWDIFIPSDSGLIQYRPYIETLDCGRIPNAQAFGVPGACTALGLRRDFYADALAYNTKAFPVGREPRGWADFFDVSRFPGPRGMPGASWAAPYVLSIVLLADGVPADKLFPLDLDRAFRKLDTIRPHVAVWWRTGDQSSQILRNEEVVMAHVWSGRALTLRAQGAPVAVVWNQGLIGTSWWSLVKGAPHPGAAYAFLNFFMTRPEAHAAFTKRIFYSTPHKGALEQLGEQERREQQTYPANWEKQVTLDHRWIAQNNDLLVERWNKWISR